MSCGNAFHDLKYPRLCKIHTLENAKDKIPLHLVKSLFDADFEAKIFARLIFENFP